MMDQEEHTLLIDILILKQTLSSSLCDYSDPYIVVKGNITVNTAAAADADASNTNKKSYFKLVLHLLNA